MSQQQRGWCPINKIGCCQDGEEDPICHSGGGQMVLLQCGYEKYKADASALREGTPNTCMADESDVWRTSKCFLRTVTSAKRDAQVGRAKLEM